MSERAPLLEPDAAAVPLDEDDNYLERSAFYSLRRSLVIIICLFFLIFLTTCNVSLLTTIQSPIAAEFDASSEVKWFNSALLIAAASFMPLSGKLCQVFTASIYLLCSAVLQAVGLAMSAFAPKVTWFIAGRVLYGVGTAAVAPIALTLIKDYAPERIRGTLYGLVNSAFTVGITCGALLGAALEPHIGWRAIFWMQCPLVLCLSVIVSIAIYGSEPPSDIPDPMADLSMSKRLARLDYLGIMTLVASVVLLLYGLSAGRLQIWSIVLSFVLLFIFVLIEFKFASDPIIPATILKSRGAILTGVATIGFLGVRWSILFYTPTHGIAVLGWSEEKAGLLLIPTNAGFALGGLCVGVLHIRKTKSYYTSTILCSVLFAISQFSMALLSTPESNIPLLIVALFLNGFIEGALLNYTLTHLLHITLPRHTGIVIAFIMMFRALGGAFGSSLSSSVFNRSLQASLHRGFAQAKVPHKNELIRQLLSRPKLVQKLSGIEKYIAISSYSSSLYTLYTAGAVLVVAMTIVQAGAGWKAPKKHEERWSSGSEETE